MHDGGDGGDDEEENSFSDGRYHQRHQGEAASRCYGFLCFVITLFNIRGCGICSWPADLSAAVTPSANRNTYSVAILFLSIPRVEVLRPSTLGCEIATPTELPEGSPILAFPKGGH